MKILVLQLARFGDIYQTWPILNALARKYPDATIHLGVRERYAKAANLKAVDKLIALPTKKILSPLIFSEEGIENSLIEMDRYIDLFDKHYDQIINLSFSPFSSYLVQDLKSNNTKVMGYDRFEDGFLKIGDDASAYFYGQVGVARYNRLHLVDIFAMVANVEVKESDFSWNQSENQGFRQDRPYYVIHVGASKAHKTCSHETWESILRVLLKKTDNIVYLVGTAQEKIPSEWIETQNRIIDLCGKTELNDLFPLVSGAQALIAGDSMLVQIANLTSTVCLNLSFPTVNFWETGPRTKESRILYYPNIESVKAQDVALQLEAIKAKRPAGRNVFVCQPNGHILYRSAGPLDTDFQWALVFAMYMGSDFPIAEKIEVVIAFGRIHELATVGIENLQVLSKDPNNQVSMSIINEIDQLMVEIGRRCKESQPLVQWFLTEKSRIGPARFEKVLEITVDVFEQLKTISNLYTLNEELPVNIERRDLAWK